MGEPTARAIEAPGDVIEKERDDLRAMLGTPAPPVADEQAREQVPVALPWTLPTPREVHTVCTAAGLVRDGDEWRDEHVSVEAVTTSCQPLAIDDDRPMYGIHVNDLRGFRSEQMSEQISGRLLWHTIRDVQTAERALLGVSALPEENRHA